MEKKMEQILTMPEAIKFIAVALLIGFGAIGTA
ncbi:MAG: F-type H+-transporting ATPase subunit c, partial [Colwellia sp.]